jgi:hypothetical protein
VTKRHQTNRRKSFSRRQHELRERPDRRALSDRSDAAWGDGSTGVQADAFAFLDSRSPRIRFALGD